ncbi:MAG TPA: hypothetical protein ENK91_04390, partial [Bacteroidetes bacterium]|nr:hypothetical protein [Bacteroidota bacterium]
LDVNIIPDSDTLSFCGIDSVSLKAMGDGFLNWTPSELIDNPDSSVINYFGKDSSWVVLKSHLIDSLNDNCLGYDSIYIQNTLVDLKINGDSIKKVCPNTEFDVNISTNLTNYSLLWSPVAKIKSETQKTSAIFKADSSDFMVYVELLGEGGCYAIDSIWIDVSENRVIGLTTDPFYGFFIGDTININSSVSPPLVEEDNIRWNVNTEFFEESKNQISIVLDKNKIAISYELIDENGCMFMDTLNLMVDERKLLFPNAIFPEDPDNAIFKFYKWYNGLEIITFEIFDRWGEKVFSCQEKDCAIKGWDASYLNRPVSPGVYLYKCIVKTLSGRVEEYKGSVSVLR